VKKYLFILCLLPVSLVALASTKAEGQDVVWNDDARDANITYITLRWRRNPEPDIAGYSVYYGRDSDGYTRLEIVTDATAIVGVQGSQTVYFAVTAINTSGVESALSNEVYWPLD